ncbi:hypothetical protein CY34DRAFT_800938 [Suillus luteus UH-Slu-Lm8-n1]|uniref:Uncharacterized protein n=1 Tax=Suillus luteus UH-Slu-Lm8-n1 TaxID=930992 RepID=A0A0D0B8D8_9AGAM|nr:hypothetical protein CY34DRAFT_800938 [Suillus luteus UH-Slu-Lm8-n1]
MLRRPLISAKIIGNFASIASRKIFRLHGAAGALSVLLPDKIQHNRTDLSLAVKNFKLASTHPTQGFPEHIKEAIDWALQAEIYQHESALEAYQVCLELFDSHMMTRSSIISRRDAAIAFRGGQSLPVDAASCAIRRNDLQRAVEPQEQGRGQQWSLASQLS